MAYKRTKRITSNRREHRPVTKKDWYAIAHDKEGNDHLTEVKHSTRGQASRIAKKWAKRHNYTLDVFSTYKNKV